MVLMKSLVTDRQLLSEILIVSSWLMSVVFTYSNTFCPLKRVIYATNHLKLLTEVGIFSSQLSF